MPAIPSTKDIAVNNRDQVLGFNELSSSEGDRQEANNYTDSWKTQGVMRRCTFRVLIKEGVCGIGGLGQQGWCGVNGEGQFLAPVPLLYSPTHSSPFRKSASMKASLRVLSKLPQAVPLRQLLSVFVPE